MQHKSSKDSRILRFGIGGLSVAAFFSAALCVGSWTGRFDAGHGGIPIGAMFGNIPLAILLTVVLFPFRGILGRCFVTDSKVFWVAVALWLFAQTCNGLAVFYLIRAI